MLFIGGEDATYFELFDTIAEVGGKNINHRKVGCTSGIW